MKTYIAITTNGMLATESNNLKTAKDIFKNYGHNGNILTVKVSDVHIDYAVNCKKID